MINSSMILSDLVPTMEFQHQLQVLGGILRGGRPRWESLECFSFVFLFFGGILKWFLGRSSPIAVVQ